MSSLREIKDRIGSVRSTLKITNAMKLVSSAKLRKAQQAIEALRPYEATLSGILADAQMENPRQKGAKTSDPPGKNVGGPSKSAKNARTEAKAAKAQAKAEARAAKAQAKADAKASKAQAKADRKADRIEARQAKAQARIDRKAAKAEAKAARRAERAAAKAEACAQRAAAKAERKAARAEAREAKAQARAARRAAHKPLPKWIWVTPLVILALAAVAAAIFYILVYAAPDFLDTLLYTPEELRIINW